MGSIFFDIVLILKYHVFFDDYTRIFVSRWHESSGALCHPLLSPSMLHYLAASILVCHQYRCRVAKDLFSVRMAPTLTPGIRLEWSSPITRDSRTCCRKFCSGAVTVFTNFPAGIRTLNLAHARRPSNVLYRRGNINNPTSLNSVRKDITVYVRKHYNHLFPGIFRHFCLLRWRCSRGFPHTGFSLPFCFAVIEPCLICGNNSVEEFPLPNSNSSCLYRSRLRNFFEHEILFFFPKLLKVNESNKSVYERKFHSTFSTNYV